MTDHTAALARIAEIRRDPSNYADPATASVCIEAGLFRDGVLVDGAGDVLELVNGVEEIARLEKAAPATLAPRFRKKPVVIDAIQFTGGNALEIGLWVGGFLPATPPAFGFATDGSSVMIPTLEGNHRCDVGSWIIRGVKGEYYPCKPDIFAATYDAVVPDGDRTLERNGGGNA